MHPLRLALPVLVCLASAPAHADSTVVFNEVMYHPASDPAALEWVELYNQMGVDMDISGWSLAGAIDFPFPERTILRGKSYLVVALSPAALAAASGHTGALGPFTGRLDDRGETIVLLNNSGRTMDSLDYNDTGDWPVGPDGSGVTLSKLNPDLASGPAVNWGASLAVGGTPGKVNFPAAPPLPSLAFNEFSLSPGADPWFELVNHGAAPVALDGLVLVRAGPTAGRYVFPVQSLAAGEFLAAGPAGIGFNLLTEDKLFLFTADEKSLIAAIRLEEKPRAREVPGTGRWLVPEVPTPAAANSFALHGEVVINEILYHARPLQASPAVVEETEILPLETTWKYHQAGGTPGADWAGPEFDDSAWPSGPALLYNETADLPAPKRTPLTLGPVTFYFRTSFDFPGDPDGVNLVVRPIIDDGAVFYLNGEEVQRFNMLDGDVSPDTPASPGVGDATFTAPLPIPPGHLRQGTNVLAVEVHQGTPGSSDVVFGVVLLSTVTVREAVQFRESPEAWIELHNLAAAAVDLTGWSLSGGIRYGFEDGQILPAGGYLVVAGDKEFLKALHPAVSIAGNFEGRLSRGGERVVLRDSSGNPADEVRYFDGGRWPIYADGGGSSLELLDPRADNSAGEVWAPSDETGKTAWEAFAYRGVAAANIGPTRWQEVVVGLLDEGDVLLDDLSVVDTLLGAERVQNGDFEEDSNHWRFLGNHQLSEVIADPDDPSNHALRIVATGPTEHMHNHLESTLTAAIANGREYEISFRARWLAGSNQLNTRLYFNRLPRTTLLPVPARAGTPGARNSRFAENVGPTYRGFEHRPVAPRQREDAVVSVEARDPDGVIGCTLWWSVNGGAWQSAPMDASGGALFRKAIPGQAASALVQFYVEGTDGLGAKSSFPAGGRLSRALLRVYDGQALPGKTHTFRILMTPADATRLHEQTNVMSNFRLPATIVYDELEPFYDAGVRLKGSERGRPVAGRVGFNVEFQPDRLFRGVHQRVHVDRSGGWAFGGPNGQDEILIKHMVNKAGGIPGMYDDVIRVVAPQAAQNGSALLLMARYDEVYLDSQYAGGAGGVQYKIELIYYPTSTADGSAEGLKLPQPDDVLGADVRDLGDDKEVYRWNFLLENHRPRDDYGPMIGLAKAHSAPAATLEAAANAAMDVSQWMRAFAVISLTGVNDIYTQGNNHNFIFYQRPEDGRMLAFPWDMDFSFTRSTSSPLWGDQNLSRIINLIPNRRLFYCHLRDLLAKSFNPEYMSPWVSHYGSLAGQNWASLLTYMGQRRTFVNSQIPASVPFSITTNGGADFTVDQPSTFLQGNGWIDVKAIVVAEASEPLPITWPGLTQWRATVALHGGANALNLLAFDIDGNLLASDTITVTSSADPQFIRGDASRDGRVELTDAVAVLFHLFAGLAIDCRDAADCDNNEVIEVTDAIFILDYLFRGGAAPAPPHPGKGADPDGAGPLECRVGI